jgi:hypothetical protein
MQIVQRDQGFLERRGRGRKYPEVLARTQRALGSATPGASATGQLIRVVRNSAYGFDGRAATIRRARIIPEIVLGWMIPSPSWAAGMLVVHLWSRNNWAATARASIVVERMPGREVVARIDIEAADPAPARLMVPFTAPAAASVRVILQWSQGRAAADTLQAISIGVDLIGKAGRSRDAELADQHE